jgi:hypothetical protein
MIFKQKGIQLFLPAPYRDLPISSPTSLLPFKNPRLPFLPVEGLLTLF